MTDQSPPNCWLTDDVLREALKAGQSAANDEGWEVTHQMNIPPPEEVDRLCEVAEFAAMRAVLLAALTPRQE